MNSVDRNNIFELLKSELPSYEFERDRENGLHIVFSLFTQNLLGKLQRLPTDSKQVSKFFNVINKMAESRDEYILDVLGTTVFIGLYDELGSDELFRSYFSFSSKKLYEETIDLWQSGNDISGFFQ